MAPENLHGEIGAREYHLTAPTPPRRLSWRLESPQAEVFSVYSSYCLKRLSEKRFEQRLDRDLGGMRSRDSPKKKRVGLSRDHAIVVSKAFPTVSRRGLLGNSENLEGMSIGLGKKVSLERVWQGAGLGPRF
jgi:hypothetical protein